MHIQHIESTSGHIGNISGPPLPQSKVDIGHPNVDTHSFKRHKYILGWRAYKTVDQL
jgi:hypothetical protein